MMRAAKELIMPTDPSSTVSTFGINTYLLRRRTDSYVAVRKIICNNPFSEIEGYMLWHYIEYAEGRDKPFMGASKTMSLKAWGRVISEEEALKIMPQLNTIKEE